VVTSPGQSVGSNQPTLPPRYLKSICASVAFPAWVLGQDPTRRLICVSYSQDLARKHALDTRTVMAERLRQLLRRSDQRSAIRIILRHVSLCRWLRRRRQRSQCQSTW
jgi:hypothetical protein